MYRGLIILLLLFCSCQKSDIQSNSTDQKEKISPISKLWEVGYNSSSTAITQNIIIEGVVTANDKFSEFDNKIIIEDSSGAVEIMLEADGGNAKYFKFGTHVRLYAFGLWVSTQRQKLTVGTRPTSEYSVDYIPSKQLFQYLRLMQIPLDPPTAQEREINTLSPRDISRLVTIDSLTFISRDTLKTFCRRDSLTNRSINTSHILSDPQGNRVELFVNAECEYSDNNVPKVECAIQAIVNYFDGNYSLTITNFTLEY